MVQVAILSAAAGTVGVLSHLFFFHVGERHLFPLRYVQALILAYIVTAAAISHYGEVAPRQALSVTTKVVGAYLVGLYSSLAVYRLFFNPLNSLPGPYFARFTKFNHVFRNLKFDGHKQLLRLHQKYGRIVRIGPYDVSVTDPEGVQVISGPQSKCTKATWYSQDSPLTSLHTTRDRAVHDRRRRIWSPAFSDKALRGYEHRIQTYNDLLMSKVDEHIGKPMDMAHWFNCYSFDVMGDLGFNSSFGMLESGETHWAIKLLSAGMDPMALGLPPWFFRVLIAIPPLTAEYHRFIKFCSDQLQRRQDMHEELKKGKSDQDITHTLIEHFNSQDEETKRAALPTLQGDSRLIIVAGSDTTAATLVHLWYHIAADQDLQTKLRNEVKQLVGENNKLDHSKLQDAPILNGSINETLRIHPPVPSGVFRETPKEGVHIAGTFIAGETVVQMPWYAMARDPTIYPLPLSFLPERWNGVTYAAPSQSQANDLLPYPQAWTPFNTGPYGCIGKALAYLEIRTLTAQILLKFDVKLAPGEDGKRLLEDTTDHFTSGLAPCDMVFSRREKF